MESVLSECESSIVSNDASLCEYFSLRLDAIITNLEELMQYVGSHSQLQHLRERARTYIHRFEHSNSSCTQPVVSINVPHVEMQASHPGRPILCINIDQVEMLRQVGYSWLEVSEAVGVSRSTLWRRLQERNVTITTYTDISDNDLDEQVKSIQNDFPNAGLVMIQGHLQSMGIRVQRARVRQSVAHNDPIRRKVRWHQALSRRSYSVPGPNALWHIDGHHSLIRWRFIIHGGIDGHSRLIVYLQCTTNNQAASVFAYFWQATREYGVPSRVRSDKGGENVMVCHFMVSQRGIGRGSHIAGPSTHNQRIERLWRDVYRCVASTYYDLFYCMEEEKILDPNNDVDLFVLHCLFLPQINHALEKFSGAWNQHSLRTERMWSPRKIWINGMLRHGNQADNICPDLDTYGLDPDGPVPVPENSQEVMVPEILSPFNDADQQCFLDGLTLLQQEQGDDRGRHAYCAAKRLLNEIMQETDVQESDSESN